MADSQAVHCRIDRGSYRILLCGSAAMSGRRIALPVAQFRNDPSACKRCMAKLQQIDAIRAPKLACA